MYNPNITSSYNNKLYETFTAKGDNEKYYKQLNNQARLMEVDDTSSSDEESSNEKWSEYCPLSIFTFMFRERSLSKLNSKSLSKIKNKIDLAFSKPATNENKSKN